MTIDRRARAHGGRCPRATPPAERLRRGRVRGRVPTQGRRPASPGSLAASPAGHSPDRCGGDLLAQRDPLGGEEHDVEAGHELARHLISAIRLSKCSEVATTAAIMEVVRHVARDLVLSPEVPRSRATTVCLAALPQSSDRPEWFVDEMLNMLRDRLGNDLCRQIGSKMISGKKEG